MPFNPYPHSGPVTARILALGLYIVPTSSSVDRGGPLFSPSRTNLQPPRALSASLHYHR